MKLTQDGVELEKYSIAVAYNITVFLRAVWVA